VPTLTRQSTQDTYMLPWKHWPQVYTTHSVVVPQCLQVQDHWCIIDDVISVYDVISAYYVILFYISYYYTKLKGPGKVIITNSQLLRYAWFVQTSCGNLT
jgi:hypothetical protein